MPEEPNDASLDAMLTAMILRELAEEEELNEEEPPDYTVSVLL